MIWRVATPAPSVFDAPADRSLHSADVGVAEALEEAPVASADLFGMRISNREHTLETYSDCRVTRGLSPVATLPPAGD